jgi:endoglucanase
LLVLCGSAAPYAGAYIRADQLGYETGVAGRAYFISTAAEQAASFTVVDASGHTIVSAPVGKSTGRWGSYHVYPLHFTLPSAGAYTVTVAHGRDLARIAVTAASAGLLYRQALANALSFYQNERDGADFIPSRLRTAPGHLNDAAATVYATPATRNDLIVGPLTPAGATINAAGGWWDAGDYLKFVETHSYTVGMMLTGLRDFPAQMGPGSGADFTAEAKFGLDWLQRMWDEPSKTLYYEVGIGIDFANAAYVSDHDIWRLPQVDDTLGGADPNYTYIQHRPVFAAGPAGAAVSPNLAGRLAADFALCFMQYRATDLAYAQKCLQSGEDVFDLADTAPAALLTTLPYDFYPEIEWRDDLEWGAVELNIALATGGADVPGNLPHAAPYYLTQAANWASAYITGPNDAADTLNLYDVAGLAHFDLIRAINLAGNPGGLAVTVADLEADLLKQLSRATAQAATDPFGFGFAWDQYDTTSHGDGLAVTAGEYAYLLGGGWNVQSADWLGNVLGENIWGVSLLVGDGSNFTDCLQHQVANISGSLTGGAPMLAGGAVEGPNAIGAVAHGFLTGMRTCPADGIDVYKEFTGRGARFEDNVQNYANTEPAIDLTATSPLMFAWRMAGAPQPLTALRGAARP